MISFEERLALEKHFNAWAEKEGLSTRPMNMVSWLISKGMLDERGAKEFLRKELR